MQNSFLIDIFIECTVCIQTAERKGGTGFFVAPGYVLTCAHVVLDAWKNQISVSIYWRNEKIGDAKVIQCCNIDYPDLALLQIGYTEHPCVYLDQEISLNDELYSYGYPKDHRDGDSVTFLYEGLTGLQKPLLKLKAGQAIPGMSGAPLLNLRTGKICGIIRSTRNEYSDLGGRAISTETILVNLPKLATLHNQFHYQDKRWLNNLSILPEPILNHMSLSRVLASEVEFLQTDRHPFRTSSRSDFYSYISLPINYIERKTILSAMREKLTNDKISIGRTPYAIHGMGGLGKTVLARALCEDPIIQATFPDGILWATLGQRSKNEFVPTMRSWVELLGGSIHENAPTIESLKNLLASLLKDRSCLLILDDVWRYSDAEIFRVGGKYCGLLLTLRDAEIAYELGAKIQAVPFMTNSEAIALLEAWGNSCLVKKPLYIKEKIVARLGYLPLAIKLAGAQLRRSEPDKWLQTFDIRKLKSSRPENLHDDLELTFRISMESLDEQYLTFYIALAIFKKSRPILVAGIMHLWRSLGHLGSEGIENILNDLASRALIEISQYDSVDFVIIHDLIYDIISHQLGNKTENTHQMLINEYSSGQKDVDWSTIYNDGYLYDNLAFHLYAAKSGEELKKLFINPRWLHARVRQGLYTYDGYLEDLTLVWKWAIDETKGQIDNNQPPQSFVDCMRYLLLESSIHRNDEKLT